MAQAFRVINYVVNCVIILFSVFFSQREEGDDESRKMVDKLMPQKVKKRRKIQTEDGVLIKILYLIKPIIMYFQVFKYLHMHLIEHVNFACGFCTLPIMMSF